MIDRTLEGRRRGRRGRWVPMPVSCRPDVTRAEQSFHTDNSYNVCPPECVGLLCLQTDRPRGRREPRRELPGRASFRAADSLLSSVRFFRHVRGALDLVFDTARGACISRSLARSNTSS